MPVQASVETFGCPWINFGQFIFIDFDTGTTMDNKYGVTGITHNLSPGKFTTSLTLTYGDVYGQYEQATNLIESVTSELNAKKNDIVNIDGKIHESTNNTDIKIICENFSKLPNNKKYFVSSLAFEPKKDKEAQLDINNELYYDNYSKFINLMIYNNTFTNNFLVNSSKETINRFIEQSNTNDPNSNLFPIIFKEEFIKNKNYSYKVFFKENPLGNKPFIFNVFHKTKDKVKNTSNGVNLIIGQYSNSKSTVDLISPKLLNGSKSFDFVDYNKINKKIYDSFKKSLDTEIRNINNNFYKINGKQSGKHVNLSISNLAYENTLNLIDQAYKDSGNNILSLRIRSLSLFDIIQRDFSKSNEDSFDFWGLFKSSSVDENIAERRDLFRQKITVKKTSGQVISGAGIQPTYLPPREAKTFYQKKKLGQASSLTSQSNVLEFNLKTLKNLFGKNERVGLKLTRFQNFNIFKSLKVSYDSSAQVEFNAQPSASVELKKHDSFKLYEVSLNTEVIKLIKQITPIYDISILENNTNDAKIQISVKKVIPELSDGFAEYKEQTAPNISIIEPEIDFITIFDPNYILDNDKKLLPAIPQGISRGIVETKSGPTSRRQKPTSLDRELSTDEYQDETVASDNIEYIEYTIKISELVNYIKAKTNNLFSGRSNKILVYSHMPSSSDSLGKLGNDMFIDNVDIIDSKINKELKNFDPGFRKFISIKNEKFNGSAYAISLTNRSLYNPFRATINDTNLITWNSKLNNANNATSQIVEATNEEYRNIKLANLPAVNKQSLNLKVMDPWVPSVSTTSFDLTGNTSLEFVEKADIAKVNAQFLQIENTVVDAKNQLNKVYQNSHVKFDSIINTAAKNLYYLDYKVSDLEIQYKTPDKIESKISITGEKTNDNSNLNIKILRYSPQIINNNVKIGLTIQRRTKIQPRLFGILLAAMKILQQSNYGNKFDEIVIRSGGDIPLYLVNSRTLSKTIRHDSGYAVDIQIKRKGKAIGLKSNPVPSSIQDIDNNLIWFYLKTCKELGATGIGADYDYDKGKAFHIDIAKDNPDFNTDKYKRSFKIDLKGKTTTITQAQVNRSMNSITSVRYWGKSDEGSFKKEAAPLPLKEIFK